MSLNLFFIYTRQIVTMAFLGAHHTSASTSSIPADFMFPHRATVRVTAPHAECHDHLNSPTESLQHYISAAFPSSQCTTQPCAAEVVPSHGSLTPYSVAVQFHNRKRARGTHLQCIHRSCSSHRRISTCLRGFNPRQVIGAVNTLVDTAMSSYMHPRPCLP